jgi:hypothetical protein
MSADKYFSKTYHNARTNFLTACRELHLRPVGLWAEETAVGSEPPLVDCLRLGSPGATNLLVILGGDRLADALCCSAIITGWLREFGKANLPSDSALLLLHHGAAPRSGGEIPDAGGPPPQWEDDILARVEERYAEYARQQGIDATGAPLDQPRDGDVPGYPGALMDKLAHAMTAVVPDRIVFVEVRIGTGPWGEAELTPCHPPNSDSARRIRKWFSQPEPSEDDPPGERGMDHLGAGLQRRFPDSEIIAARATFGTYSMMSVLENLAARPEDRATPDAGRMIHPDSTEWREAVWRSAVVIIQRALTGLHSR